MTRHHYAPSDNTPDGFEDEEGRVIAMDERVCYFCISWLDAEGGPASQAQTEGMCEVTMEPTSEGEHCQEFEDHRDGSSSDKRVCDICRYKASDDDYFHNTTEIGTICRGCSDEFPSTCQQCGGEIGALGILGRLVHFACRNCGLQSSKSFSLCAEEYRG